MKRFCILAVYLAILAIWVQLLVPVDAANTRPNVDPFSIVCSHPAPGSKDGSKPVQQSGDHHCCTFCHAQLGGVTVDDRPLFTVLDHPVASPLRWRLVVAPPSAAPSPPQYRPRGPPTLV